MTNEKTVVNFLQREKNGRAVRVDGRFLMEDYTRARMTDGLAALIAVRLQQLEVYVHVIAGRHCKWDVLCLTSLGVKDFSY